MGIPNLTTYTIKFKMSIVFEVDVSYIVFSLFLAYSSATFIIVGFSSGQF